MGWHRACTDVSREDLEVWDPFSPSKAKAQKDPYETQQGVELGCSKISRLCSIPKRSLYSETGTRDLHTGWFSLFLVVKADGSTVCTVGMTEAGCPTVLQKHTPHFVLWVGPSF